MFKFINGVAKDKQFLDVVARYWDRWVLGNPSFVVWTKLLHLQGPLRKLGDDFSRASQAIIDARGELGSIQQALILDRQNGALILQEKKLTAQLLLLRTKEESLLRQKSKATWIQLGDGNNAFFHARLKARNANSGFQHLVDDTGRVCNSDRDIEDEVVRYFTNLVGSKRPRRDFIDFTTFKDGPLLGTSHARALISPVTDDEIWGAVCSLGDNKAPGPDGFSSKFFKASWSIIRTDVSRAVRDFFNNNRLYRAVNSTLVSLIPKKKEVVSIRDMRPISCCTTLYKIISKILTARLDRKSTRLNSSHAQ